MDYLTKKEIEGLKQDIKARDIAVEADKYVFETKLLNGLGESMMQELKTPTKYSWIDKIKIKFARWKKIRQDKKEYKKIMGDF